MIRPDKIIHCPQCQKSAPFTYPFRLVEADKIPLIQEVHAKAVILSKSHGETYSNSPSFKNSHYYYVLEFWGKDKFVMSPQKDLYIINLQPAYFQWGIDSKKVWGG